MIHTEISLEEILLREVKMKNRGFTLIELMVVVAVIAILATIALFGLRSAQGSARNTQRQQIANSVRSGLERYYGDKNTYVVGTSFSDMYTTLTGLNYMSGAPVDPGCGSGAVTYPAGGVTSGSWVPCAAGSGVTYAYSGAAGSYVLTLTKEAGGSNTFSGPQ